MLHKGHKKLVLTEVIEVNQNYYNFLKLYFKCSLYQVQNEFFKMYILILTYPEIDDLLTLSVYCEPSNNEYKNDCALWNFYYSYINVFVVCISAG